MALASSGTISMGGSTSTRSINLELGQSASASISLNDSNARALAGVPSGSISISNFYGKSSFSRVWASYYSATGSFADLTAAYDETGYNPGTQITTSNMGSYTTAASLASGDGPHQNDSNYTLILSGVAGKTIKLVMACQTIPETITWDPGNCYADCGAGHSQHYPGNSMTAQGYVTVSYAKTYGGSATSVVVYDDGTQHLYTFAAPSDTVYVTIQTSYESKDYGGIAGPPYANPCCYDDTGPLYITGQAFAYVYTLCAET